MVDAAWKPHHRHVHVIFHLEDTLNQWHRKLSLLESVVLHATTRCPHSPLAGGVPMMRNVVLITLAFLTLVPNGGCSKGQPYNPNQEYCQPKPELYVLSSGHYHFVQMCTNSRNSLHTVGMQDVEGQSRIELLPTTMKSCLLLTKHTPRNRDSSKVVRGTVCLKCRLIYLSIYHPNSSPEWSSWWHFLIHATILYFFSG